MVLPVTPPPPRPPGEPSSLVARVAGVLVLVLLGVLIAAWGVQRYVESRLVPDPARLAAAGLQALRAEGRLSAFSARLVAVTTSRRGAGPERTLILPGQARYAVDLSRMAEGDVLWDPARQVMGVRLPPVTIDGPRIETTGMRQYGRPGGLDAANRQAAEAELTRRARAPSILAEAEAATARAVERSLALSLRTAGVEATVRVRFTGRN